MTCREFIEFLVDYTSGTLLPAERAEFERHLEVCAHCVAYLQNYREVIRLAPAVLGGPDDEVPEAVPEELVQAILAARDQRS